MKNPSDSKIHIALASDNKNVLAMATVIVSTLHNKNTNNFYVFHLLLAGDIGNEFREKLEDCAKGFEDSCQINLIDLKDKFSCINLGSYITYAAYFRLMLPSLLPNLVKIIYIDTDTLVRKNLEELWNFDIGENYIAAVPISSGQIFGDSEKYKQAGFLNREFCINSGVMLMNLSEMRANSIEEKCLAKIGDRNLCKIDTGDQVILNFICYSKIAFLPCKWNVTTDKIKCYNDYIRIFDIFYSAEELSEAFSNPAIFHWAGPQKPWIYYDLQLSHEWFRYYNKTPFKNELLNRKSSIEEKSKLRKFIIRVMRFIRNGVG